MDVKCEENKNLKDQNTEKENQISSNFIYPVHYTNISYE